jgi:hypothetical protein
MLFCTLAGPIKAYSICPFQRNCSQVKESMLFCTLAGPIKAYSICPFQRNCSQVKACCLHISWTHQSLQHLSLPKILFTSKRKHAVCTLAGPIKAYSICPFQRNCSQVKESMLFAYYIKFGLLTVWYQGRG